MSGSAPSLPTAGLHDALRDVDAARIQTIHAFAANILRERSLDAGLDPNFNVLDQLQADLRFAQSWRSWLWSNDAPQEPLKRAFDLGLELGDLQLAAEQLARNRDLTGPLSDVLPSEEIREDQRERDTALAELTTALREFIEQDANQRRIDGLLTYDDLLLEARNLLVRSKQAREDLRSRLRTILVDEFQDTDPLQAQISLLLAADRDTDDWTQVTPGPGRLVLAGDPKQSIYRFRRADIDIYEQVRDIFLAAPETSAIARLTVNFRARPQLCDWHNEVLPGVIKSDQDFPRAQARWEATVPYRTDRGPGVAVIPSNRQFDRAPEARSAEATLIANLIAHMQQDDATLGHIPTLGRFRESPNSATSPYSSAPGPAPTCTPLRSIGPGFPITSTAARASIRSPKSGRSPTCCRRWMTQPTKWQPSQRSNRRSSPPPTPSSSSSARHSERNQSDWTPTYYLRPTKAGSEPRSSSLAHCETI